MHVPPPFRWAGWSIAVAALFWFGIVMLHSTNGPLLGDYAEWTYHAALLRDAFHGQPHLYALKHYPVPNSATTVGLGLLMLAMPWAIASKLWLLLVSGCGLWCVGRLARSAGTDSAWLPLLLAVAMIFGSAFWFGFINFLLGTYVAMWASAKLLEGGPKKRLGVTMATLLTLAFFCHMVPFCFAALLTIVYSVESRRWRLLWSLAPTVLLTLWYVAGRATHGDVDGTAGMVASVPWGTGAFVAFKVNTFLKSWGFVNPATTSTDSVLLRFAGIGGFSALLVVDILLAILVFAVLVTSAQRSLRKPGGTRFFWMTVAIFMAAAIAMPGAAAGISDPGGRMMQVAIWCGICVAVCRWRAAAAAVGCCALVLLLADAALFARVAMQPEPVAGVDGGPLPGSLRQFAHVYYGDRWPYYRRIESGEMDLPIYPTALFVKQPGK